MVVPSHRAQMEPLARRYDYQRGAVVGVYGPCVLALLQDRVALSATDCEGHYMTQDTSDVPDINDPEVYWPMAIYAGKVQVALMMLRHLYEPQEAMQWLTSAQPLLQDRVPCDLMLTTDGARLVEALIARICDGAFS